MKIVKCHQCKKFFHQLPDDVNVCMKCLAKKEAKENGKTPRR